AAAPQHPRVLVRGAPVPVWIAAFGAVLAVVLKRGRPGNEPSALSLAVEAPVSAAPRFASAPPAATAPEGLMPPKRVRALAPLREPERVAPALLALNWPEPREERRLPAGLLRWRSRGLVAWDFQAVVAIQS